jgi:hypothetical protein
LDLPIQQAVISRPILDRIERTTEDLLRLRVKIELIPGTAVKLLIG